MLTVTREAPPLDSYASTARHSWPVRFSAVSDAPELSAKIFKFHAPPPGQPQLGDLYEGVCGLVDLLELPEDEPTEEMPYYRSAEFTLVCRSAAEAEEVVANVWSNIEELVGNWKASRNLMEIETRTFE